MAFRRDKMRLVAHGWNVKRLVLLTAAVGLAAYAVRAFPDHSRRQRELAAAELAEIGALTVDLSRPGSWDVVVSGRYRAAHGCSLALSVPGAGNSAAAQQLLGGLKATIVRVDGGGKAFPDPLNTDRVNVPRPGEIWLDTIGGGPEKFTWRIEVEQGAPNLAGTTQRLYARNSLCGLESLPVLISGALAWGSAVLAAVVGSVVAARFWRRGVVPDRT